MRGVALNKQTGKWRATLRGIGPRGYIGEFATSDEAAAARRFAEVALHGAEHADPAPITWGEIAFIPLIGHQGSLRGFCVVDAADLCIVGNQVWNLSASGYAVARTPDGYRYLHRLVMPDGEAADHINGEKLDCRRANLRPCTQRENARNAARPRSSTTGFKGVKLTPEGRFKARITVDYREVHLGVFDEPEDAARAYDAAARQHFGAFARTNFPQEQAE